MANGVKLTEIDILRLQQFHEAHFPKQTAIQNLASRDVSEPIKVQAPDEDDLGYYHDGVKRTLTDEQIAMFRNSEIQRLLQLRRRQQEVEHDKREDYRRQSAPSASFGKGPSRYDNDATVHNQNSTDSLMYDEAPQVVPAESSNKQHPQTFIWPKLGA